MGGCKGKGNVNEKGWDLEEEEMRELRLFLQWGGMNGNGVVEVEEEDLCMEKTDGWTGFGFGSLNRYGLTVVRASVGFKSLALIYFFRNKKYPN